LEKYKQQRQEAEQNTLHRAATQSQRGKPSDHDNSSKPVASNRPHYQYILNDNISKDKEQASINKSYQQTS
jgi:hypothetical protein